MDISKKQITVGTVEMQIWRRYPEKLLPEEVVNAWKNVPMEKVEGRAGTFEDYPRWSDQSRNTVADAPQEFKIGLVLLFIVYVGRLMGTDSSATARRQR